MLFSPVPSSAPRKVVGPPMSLAVSLASLFFFSSFAVAGIYAPGCSSSSWKWSFNKLDQNACTVAAYMISTCNGGS
ncbi:hypothetical protein DFH94DRAFT_781185 [Russula ochroleuca]|uniref:Uncharacterized protein n=1 Tax=Russula ochroleuca TaxID=152965 RepID=A0A9P5MQG4_9AGAM|nr:hypothetical protein DFH94DRAFT_781185 [Russula ochroleuca]